MNKYARPGKDVSPRTRSYVSRPRKRRPRRFYAHFTLALMIAVLGNAWYYRYASELPINGDPVQAYPISGSHFNQEPSQTPTLVETTVPTRATPKTIPITQSPPEPTPTVPTPIPPSPSPTPTATEPAISPTPAPPIMYYTLPGDTLFAVAARFGVAVEQITTSETLPQTTLLNPGILLLIPHQTGETTSSTQVMPDSEVVFSPSAIDFDVAAFVEAAGGHLNSYNEYLGSTGVTSGAEVIQRVALENSINPRLLLAILEYKAHWVYGAPTNLADTYYPLGNLDRDRRGLFQQLTWAVGRLSIGYYGWRSGNVINLDYPDGDSIRLAPDLNAGSVAVQYLFSKMYAHEDWAGAMYGEESFPSLYERMFGSPWLIAQTVEPLFPSTLTQPPMELPFMPGQAWAFSGGPHPAWNHDGAWAALDFAPPSMESGCVKSNNWVTATATGVVVRSERGVVVLDLDGDGIEQTGWTVLYLHIATEGRPKVGKFIEVGGLVGHPSCEGGQSTGTHVHIARKYNGEWILADGPMPFDLSGWQAHAGEVAYRGTLVKDDQIVKANTSASAETHISRTRD